MLVLKKCIFSSILKYSRTYNIIRYVNTVKTPDAEQPTMEEDVPLVTISTGILRGRALNTENGFKYFSFKGIPYAKPPLGSLRFKAPEPALPWTGVKDATKEGNISVQYDMFKKTDVIGDEDCLFLNVNTPSLAANANIPVMVYIHGGAFMSGSGNSDFLGPDYFVQEDIVLVTFNYRLGALGFLSSGDDVIPGNAALKDQVAALCWVQENIHNFGGDSKNVTIFGSSAGATCVHYLMLSDSTYGLFGKAISQSGTALNSWAMQHNPRENLLDLCHVMDNETDDLDAAISFLNSAPAEELVKANHKLAIACNKAMVFVPTIETFSNEDPIITRDPLEDIRRGKCTDMPYMCGFASEEGLINVRSVMTLNKSYLELNSDPTYFVPDDIPNKKKRRAWDKINKYYFNGEYLHKDNIEHFVHLKTDTEFLYGINKTVQEHTKVSDSPVYYYRYNFDECGVIKTMCEINMPGVCHGDEMAFLFKVKFLNLKFDKNTAAGKTHRRLIKMWTNFAKTGNPTPITDDLIDVIWKPTKFGCLNCLNIGKELEMLCNPEEDRLEFINKLYKSCGSVYK